MAPSSSAGVAQDVSGLKKAGLWGAAGRTDPVRLVRGMLRRRARLSPQEHERRDGLNQLQRFEGILNQHGHSLKQFTTILDFGCGNGRLTKLLVILAPQAEVVGCDISSENIREARRACPEARLIRNEPIPPLALPDHPFDLILSYSVFTHLSEPNHLAWLTELARRLRPGGVMLHTTHSYECLRRLAAFSPESIQKYQLPEPLDAFIQSGRGYHYVPYGPSTPEHGLAIISRAYVEQRWPTCTALDLLAYVEGAIEAYPEGCQDVVLLGGRPKDSR